MKILFLPARWVAMVGVWASSVAIPFLCQAQSANPNPAQPDCAYFAAYRAPGHVKMSKPDIFHGIVTDVTEFLETSHICQKSDPARPRIETEDPIPMSTLLNITKGVGATHLLYLTVDRPAMKWVKITLQCFDTSGKLAWEESTSDGGGVSGKKGVEKALIKLKKQLEARLGQAGLRVLAPASGAPAGSAH